MSAVISADSSPGPRYHYDARMTRFGRMESPSYSILGRGRPTKEGSSASASCTRLENTPEMKGVVLTLTAERFHTPGPGAYSPERAPPVNAHRRAPSYTMGGRTRYRGVDAAPAPNR